MNPSFNRSYFVRISLILFIALILVLPSTLQRTERNTLSAQTDLTGIRVGVFNAGTLAAGSDVALYHMFEWMGATVEYVDGPAIRGGILNSLDILAFPGGSMLSFSFNLTQTGMEQIRIFVASGGSYFGICGGALFATEFLGFCTGSWATDIPGISGGIHLTEMTVHQDCTGPDLSDEPSTYRTLYWGSSFFTPENPTNIIPIMSYPENEEPGMFVARYGSGTLFCSSPHPEYEEGDSRDGTSQYDYLNDPDSEWILLHKISQWLINESPYNPGASLPPGGLAIILVVIFATGISIIAIGAAYYYRHKQRNT